MSRDASTRSLVRCLWALTALSWVTILGGLLCFVVRQSRGGTPELFDDSLMFVRYADNLLTHRRLSWNPGGPPTHGLTSPLYLAVVLPLRLFVDSPTLTMTLASALSGLGFSVLLTVLLLRHVDAGRVTRTAAVFFTFFVLALGVQGAPRDRYVFMLGTHFFSGMDTTFSLCFLTAYILLIQRFRRDPGAGATLFAALGGGLAFGVRPDLLLFTLGVPAALVVFGAGEARRRGAWLFALTGAIVALELLFARLHFGSALPLPFHAKTTNLDQDLAFPAYHNLDALVSYLHAYRLFFAVIAVDLLSDPRGWRRRSSPLEKGLLLATVLYLAFFVLGVRQAMGFACRFYHPTLPAVLFLAAQGGARLVERIRPRLERFAEEASPRLFRWASVLVAAVLAATFVDFARDAPLPQLRMGRFLDYHDAISGYRQGWPSRYWLGLDQFSTLPDDLVIAAGDVGYPGVMSPGKVIIDIEGLNDADFAHDFSAGRLLEERRPDVLYFPPPAYRGLVGALLLHPALARDYELFDREADLCGAPISVALRRDSRHHARLRSMLTQARDDACRPRASR